MTPVPAADADFVRAEELVFSDVPPDRADGAGPEWAGRWNDRVGQGVGVTVPVE